jgi:hypothetical protein
LFYEKKIESFSNLMKEVRLLDSDAGIRIDGRRGGLPSFVFISRTPDGYAALVYEIRGGKRRFPGRRLESREFRTTTELRTFLGEVTGKAVRAFVY